MYNTSSSTPAGIDSRGDAHLDFVTGLRGVAAFFVLLSHVWYQIWPAVPAPYGYGTEPVGLTAWFTGWLYYGHFGVVLFIVLSGFCLMRPVLYKGTTLRGRTLVFFQQRAWRILPPYYLALFLSIFLIKTCIGSKTGSQWDISLPLTSQGIWSHVLLLHDFLDSTQINYVFWSIAVEARLYLFFPALVWAWRRFGTVRVLGTVLVSIYSLIIALEIAQVQDVPPQFIGLAAHFVIGMAISALLHSRDRRWLDWYQILAWGKIALALFVLISGLCLYWGHVGAESHFALLDFLVALCVACVLFSASRGGPNNFLRSVLSHPGLLFLGMFSYSIYLVHAPLLQVLWRYAIEIWHWPAEFQFLTLLLLGVPLVLLACHVFFLFAERPFLKKPIPCQLTLLN